VITICNLMGIPFQRFELVAIPVREPEPVVEVEVGGSEQAGPGDSIEHFGLVSSEEGNAHDELADLGLVKGRRGRDDLPFFGIPFLFSRLGKKRGV
jgi:hypothetical protein